jgi:hypothetical protein
LDDLNPPVAETTGQIRKLEKASSQLDWSAPDRADSTIVARAAWAEQRPGVSFPWKYFHPAVGGDGDD